MGTGGTIITLDLGEALIGQRIDRAIADVAPDLSRERIKALLAAGAVSDDADTAITAGSAKLTRPMRVHLSVPAPVAAEAVAQDIALPIVFEDEHLLVVDKPAGMVVHPANGNPDGTMVNALLHHCAGRLSGIGGIARPGIVHRIDKDTSGLLVVAKDDATHEGLSRQFADHSIERVYRAIVSGHPVPVAGTVNAPLARSPHVRTKIAVCREGQGKHAVTHYATRARLNGATDVECRLETGRTHQVRVHMAHIGHPLVGDPVYGRTAKSLRMTLTMIGFARQALHAARLGFIHPRSGERLTFDSALPQDMQDLLAALSDNGAGSRA